MGPSPGEDKAERIDRSGFFDKTRDKIPTSTCSEWSKLGDVDHIHPLWIHRRAPWLGSSLLCDRVELPSTSFFLIRSQSTTGQAAWSGLSCGSFLWLTPPQRWHQSHLPKPFQFILQHRYISNEEKKHIEESLGHGEVNKFVSTPLFLAMQGGDVSGRKLSIPWTKILASAQAKQFGAY